MVVASKCSVPAHLFFEKCWLYTQASTPNLVVHISAYIFLAQQLQWKKYPLLSNCSNTSGADSQWTSLAWVGKPTWSITVAGRRGYFSWTKPEPCGHQHQGQTYHNLFTRIDLVKRWFFKRKLDAEQEKTINVHTHWQVSAELTQETSFFYTCLHKSLPIIQ